MMRLLSLRIHSRFRSLPAGFHIIFRSGEMPVYDQVEPICFVGLNGSGKSNVLQLLAEIFAYLEMEQLKPQPVTYPQQPDKNKSLLDFTLDYSLDELSWNLARSTNNILPNYQNNENNVAVVRIQKYVLDHDFQWGILFNGVFSKKLSRSGFPPLPRHIVGYSSGMNELVSNPFIRLDSYYADRFLTIQDPFTSDDPDNVFDDISPEVAHSFVRNRMLFLDYESNKLVTLANLLLSGKNELFITEQDSATQYSQQKKEERLQILYTMAGIEGLRSFSLTINYPKALDEEGETLSAVPLPTMSNLAIDKLIRCATTWTGDLPEAENRKRLQLDFWVNETTKKAFRHHFGSADQFLTELYALRLLNVVNYSNTLRNDIQEAPFGENLSVMLPRPEPKDAAFSVNELVLIQAGSGQAIRYRSLSDGEHQLLHIFGALMIIDQPGTLFLFDEPETHFNPKWRSRFVSLLNQLVEDPESSLSNKRQQEILLTSHSPFIVSDCKPENVFVFERLSDSTVIYHQPDFNTFGASVNQLTVKVFGKPETISDMAYQFLGMLHQQSIKTQSDINLLRDKANYLGDSVEKLMFMNFLSEQQKKLSIQS